MGLFCIDKIMAINAQIILRIILLSLKLFLSAHIPPTIELGTPNTLSIEKTNPIDFTDIPITEVKYTIR